VTPQCATLKARWRHRRVLVYESLALGVQITAGYIWFGEEKEVLILVPLVLEVHFQEFAVIMGEIGGDAVSVALFTTVAVVVDLLVDAAVVHKTSARDEADRNEQISNQPHWESEPHVLRQVLFVEDELGVVVVVLQMQLERRDPTVRVLAQKNVRPH
jgi:hypothetical protein